MRCGWMPHSRDTGLQSGYLRPPAVTTWNSQQAKGEIENIFDYDDDEGKEYTCRCKIYQEPRELFPHLLTKLP